MLTQSEFREMLRRDLKRAGLNQKGLAQEFVVRGEQLSDVSISHWVKQGYIPGSRLAMVKEILGPDSGIANVPMATWHQIWEGPKAKAADEAMDKRYRSNHSFTKDVAPVTPDELENAGRMYYSPLEQDVMRKMPRDYWASFKAPMGDRDSRHIPSYCFGGTAVQLVPVRPGTISRSLVTSALFKMAVIKALHQHEAPRAHIVMAVYAPLPMAYASTRPGMHTPEGRRSMLAMLRYDANALGIQITEVESTSEAAKLLENWATQSISEELDEYGVEDLDPDEDF